MEILLTKFKILYLFLFLSFFFFNKCTIIVNCMRFLCFWGYVSKKNKKSNKLIKLNKYICTSFFF